MVLTHRWLFLSLDLSLLPPQQHWTPNSSPPTTSSSPPPPPSAIPCLKFACQIAALFNHQRERTHTHINLLRSHCHHNIEKKGHRRDASKEPPWKSCKTTKSPSLRELWQKPCDTILYTLGEMHLIQTTVCSLLKQWKL